MHSSYVICPSVLKAIKTSYISFWKTENKVIKAQWGLLEIHVIKMGPKHFVCFGSLKWVHGENGRMILLDTQQYCCLLLLLESLRDFFPLITQDSQTGDKNFTGHQDPGWPLHFSIFKGKQKQRASFSKSVYMAVSWHRRGYTGVSGLWCFIFVRTVSKGKV